IPSRAEPHDGGWPGVVGPGCVLDPARYRILSVDYVGGRGDSSRPAAGAAWPAFTTADQAAALCALLDALEIAKLHAVVGASYGGMVALAFATRRPARLERVVAIAAAHRAHPMSTAVRSVQRRIVRLAASSGAAAVGVGIARALAMTTYRTAAEFDDRFRGDVRIHPDGPAFPVDSYLDYHADDYARTFPAESFLTLSRSLDLHRIDPRSIAVPCCLIGFDSDTLVPIADLRALAAAVPDARLTCIRSPYGHDAFLKEPATVGAAIRCALANESFVQPGTAAAPPPAGPDGQPVTRYAGRAGTSDRRAASVAVRAGIATDRQYGAV